MEEFRTILLFVRAIVEYRIDKIDFLKLIYRCLISKSTNFQFAFVECRVYVRFLFLSCRNDLFRIVSEGNCINKVCIYYFQKLKFWKNFYRRIQIFLSRTTIDAKQRYNKKIGIYKRQLHCQVVYLRDLLYANKIGKDLPN